MNTAPLRSTTGQKSDYSILDRPLTASSSAARQRYDRPEIARRPGRLQRGVSLLPSSSEYVPADQRLRRVFRRSMCLGSCRRPSN